MALAVAVGVVLPALGGPGGPPQVDTAAEELLQLLARSRELTFHARWETRTEGPNAGDPTFTIEVWRKRPDVRVDTVIVAASSRVHEAAYANGDGVDQCTRYDQDAWTCERHDRPDQGEFDDVVGAVAAELDEATVTGRDASIRGTKSRCFQIQKRDVATIDYCVDLDGIPIEVHVGTVTLTRLELTRGFQGSVFALPTASRPAPAEQPIIESVALPTLEEPINLSLAGVTADLRMPAPDAVMLPCVAGATPSHHHHVDLEQTTPVLASLRERLRADVDVLAVAPTTAALLPDQSHVALSNQRGVVRLGIDAGSCDEPGLVWDGTVASGSGTWQVDPTGTDDAYRQATGAGTFNTSLTFAPGNDTPWSLDLTGTLSVLPPGIQVELIRSYWGRLGADYAGRVVTVVFRITNTGPGDAFHVLLEEPEAGPGITPIEYRPTHLGELAPDESIDVTIRYRLGLDEQGHRPQLTRRTFLTTLNLRLADALDTVRDVAVEIEAVAPAYPPPL